MVLLLIMDNFLIKNGISNRQIQQLINFTNTDDDIKKFTSDQKRFSSLEAFEEWRKKGRSIYILTNPTEDLLGIFWLGEKDLPEADYFDDFEKEKFGITFGIRIYGEARGKGLSVGFMEKGINQFRQSRIYEIASKKGIWLETKMDNLAAIKLYLKFGFIAVSKANECGEIVMVQSESL